MSGDQQQHEPRYEHGAIYNYGAFAEYEPRIADPTGHGGNEVWGRGVPRHLLVYAIATFVPLLIVSYIWPIQVVADAMGTLMHLVGVGFLSVSVAGFLWAAPPGGVRIHQALPSIARGLRMPRLLYGWQPVTEYRAGWAPAEIVVEPDFAGPWPATQVVGPARLVRSQAASRVVRPGARPGEVGLVLLQEEGPRRGGPAVMEVPAGHVVELRAERAAQRSNNA